MWKWTSNFIPHFNNGCNDSSILGFKLNYVNKRGPKWTIMGVNCYCINKLTVVMMSGWGVGAFLRWWPPSAMWMGPLIFYGHHRGCLNNPIFSNLGLCAACCAHFMCHHKLWPTSASHPLSSLNSSLGLSEGKYYQKITIPIFTLIPQNFAFPGCFSYILFYHYIYISLLYSGWVVIAVCASVPVQGTS